jgi:PAS domain S-box-containing protein
MNARVTTSNERLDVLSSSFETDLQVDDLFGELPIGIYRATSNGQLLAANNTLVRMFGCSSLDELNNRGFEEFGFQLLCQRPELRERLNKDGEIKGHESEWSLTDGRLFFTRENLRAVQDGTAQVLFYEGTVEEVNRTETERGLVDGADLLNALMESIPDSIYFKDGASRFTCINNAQAATLGLESPEMAIGKTDFDFFTPEHAKDAFDDEQRLIETREPVIDKVERIRRGDGEFRWVSATKVPLMNRDGEVLGIAGISRDITERKNSELERQVLFRIMQGVSLTDKLSDQLQLIHQAIGEVVYAKNCYVALLDEATGLLHFEFYVDEHDQVPQPQPASEGLTGLLMKKNCPLLLTDKQQRQMVAQGEVQVMGTVSASWLGIPLRAANATIGALVVKSYENSAAFSPKDVELLTSVGSQIAMTIQQKKAQDQLERTAAMLSQSNRELQDFASVASHDLQEPLRKIQAFGDRLKSKCGEQLTDVGHDYLERMLNAAQRMQTLINDLLTFSRVTTKAQPFSKVDLAVVAREVLSDLEVRIEQSGGAVEVSELPVIDADPVQMRQLLQNLIANALKFRKPDEPPLVKIFAESNSPNAEGATWALASSEVWQISVADNGIGFDEKYLNRIFTVFQRLHGRNSYEGTGVGLAVCRRIAERHGGSITARSQPDRGATFIVKLPANQHIRNKHQ